MEIGSAEINALEKSPTEGKAVLSEEERNRRIAEAAYFRAQQRGFQAGHELEDWLEAENWLASQNWLASEIQPIRPK